MDFVAGGRGVLPVIVASSSRESSMVSPARCSWSWYWETSVASSRVASYSDVVSSTVVSSAVVSSASPANSS